VHYEKEKAHAVVLVMCAIAYTRRFSPVFSTRLRASRFNGLTDILRKPLKTAQWKEMIRTPG
jgi:hypothetical protein